MSRLLFLQHCFYAALGALVYPVHARNAVPHAQKKLRTLKRSGAAFAEICQSIWNLSSSGIETGELSGLTSMMSAI